MARTRTWTAPARAVERVLPGMPPAAAGSAAVRRGGRAGAGRQPGRCGAALAGGQAQGPHAGDAGEGPAAAEPAGPAGQPVDADGGGAGVRVGARLRRSDGERDDGSAAAGLRPAGRSAMHRTGAPGAQEAECRTAPAEPRVRQRRPTATASETCRIIPECARNYRFLTESRRGRTVSRNCLSWSGLAASDGRFRPHGRRSSKSSPTWSAFSAAWPSPHPAVPGPAPDPLPAPRVDAAQVDALHHRSASALPVFTPPSLYGLLRRRF